MKEAFSAKPGDLIPILEWTGDVMKTRKQLCELRLNAGRVSWDCVIRINLLVCGLLISDV